MGSLAAVGAGVRGGFGNGDKIISRGACSTTAGGSGAGGTGVGGSVAGGSGAGGSGVGGGFSESTTGTLSGTIASSRASVGLPSPDEHAPIAPIAKNSSAEGTAILLIDMKVSFFGVLTESTLIL